MSVAQDETNYFQNLGRWTTGNFSTQVVGSCNPAFGEIGYPSSFIRDNPSQLYTMYLSSNLFLKRITLQLAAISLVLAWTFSACSPAGEAELDAYYDVAAFYQKHEYRVPMRDGVHLYTAVYVPKDTSQDYPFLIKRSPYSSGPYGADQYHELIGPVGDHRFAREGFIFVYQDVRGRFMSEGRYLHMTPHIDEKRSPEDVDESTDMYDTVEWLLANVPNNNGRVGIWGISYPGFYAAASIIDSHPAIKASSPQAPIADWFVGDDFHHHGAFYLQDAFNFFSFFETPGPNPTSAWGPRFDYGSDDAYQFFKDLGPLPNANNQYFHHEVAFWDSLMQNGVYNDFWQRRNLLPHLHNITANVMTVAGLFDAEDPYGPINIYQNIERENPDINNTLVLGPWFHGGWVRSDGDFLNNVFFKEKTGLYYKEHVDLPFFNYYLKDKGTLDLPEVLAFATGSNAWFNLDAWPPRNVSDTALYLSEEGGLSFEIPTASGHVYDAYETDPEDPTPYTQEKTISRTREYMAEDQRFASDRSDVLVYQSDVLTEDFTFAGPITANLFVSTTGTDADYVIKLIDVYPDDAEEHQNPNDKYMDVPMTGYQMLVRGDVFRGKFRNSYTSPEAFTPGKVTPIRFETPHIFHTFKEGHHIMVHVQSAWFPISDMNPQTFIDIYQASEEDFQKATHHIYRSVDYPSNLTIGRLE